jgi:formate-dependent phosphoribosylglycinamide formyltransferase (GAR transformylase)
MRHAVFVVPFLFETSVRFLRAALRLPGVAVSLVSQDPLERFDPEIRSGLAAHWRVDDALSADHLTQAVEGLSRQIGPADRLIGVLEQLQVPLAEARERLGIPGLSAEAAECFRDKAVMKTRLREAGLPCARHSLATNTQQLKQFLDEVGFPVVVKPPAGAGAVDTFRLDSADQLPQMLATWPPHPSRPMLIEEFIVGDEHSFDAVCIHGRCVWFSISDYTPTPLEVMSNNWIQWCVQLPRELEGRGYEAIMEAGPRALDALGMGTGLAHMEWFRRPDGSIAISEVGARPPGAQFTTLLSFAHDTDMYSAWSRLMVEDHFDPPERTHSAGAAYLRGQGQGAVKAVHGLEQAQRELGELVVDVKLPHVGQPNASSYEGEGYAILRHPRTDVVEQGLKRLVEIVRVELG